MVRRIHLRADLVGYVLHRLRVRWVFAADCRLAHRGVDADRPATRRPGDGAVGARAGRAQRRRHGAPLRRRLNTPRSATPTGSPTPARWPRSAPVGDSFDNALAESVIGLYKTECVRLDGPFPTVDELELATLSWVHWFNEQRMHSAIGYVPPAEFEQHYYRQINPRQQPLSGEPALH